jgi:hypothetical protein
MKKREILILIIAVVLLPIASVLLMSQDFIAVALNLKDKTEVANLINGLTAPMIGLVGGVLVYLSFRTQVRANKIQFDALNEQRDLELLYSFYQELKEDLIRMQTEYGEKYSQPAILDSYMNYVSDDKHKDDPYPEFRLYLRFIFNQFIFISKRIKRNDTLNASEKVYVVDKVRYLFDLYFNQYHVKLTKELYTNDYSKEIKNGLEDVVSHMRVLDKIHSKYKDGIRAENKLDN